MTSLNILRSPLTMLTVDLHILRSGRIVAVWKKRRKM